MEKLEIVADRKSHVIESANAFCTGLYPQEDIYIWPRSTYDLGPITKHDPMSDAILKNFDITSYGKNRNTCP
jgi:hypothetical protein